MNSTNSFQYQEQFDFCINIAKQAGKTIKKAFYENKNVTLKSTNIDLVTQTDQAVEEYLLNSIKTKYPTHSFIGEESVAVSNNAPVKITNDPTWVIDPVDGTTNFVHKFPYTAVCIGFMSNKIVQFGVIYAPITNELFSARRGHGSTLNDEKITVSPSSPKSVKGSLIITEFGSSTEKERLNYVFTNLDKIANAGAHGIRSMGSCALNICQVASGRADAFYECGMHIWDICAASVILEEAGGCCVDVTGEKLNLVKRRIIAASNSNLAINISETITSIELVHD